MNGIAGQEAVGVAGGDIRIIEVAKHWAQAGHEIHLMGSVASTDLFERRGLTVQPHIVAWHGGESRWSFMLRALTVCLRLPRSLLRLRPDVIVSANEQLYDTLPGLILKLWYRRRVRWAVVAHNIPAWRFWQREGHHWYQSLAFLVSERLSLLVAAPGANRVLAVSPATTRQLYGLGFPKSRVVGVPCGVDLTALDAIARTTQARRYDAATFMRVSAEKGVFALIDAWKLVVAAAPNARLAIIGGGIDIEAAQARVRALGLDGNIDFLGLILDATKAFTTLRTARLFVHPSFKENWAIAIGEAMALGMPVIAFDLPELREVWGEAFRAVPKGDTLAFADEILSLLADDAGRRDLAERGRARVRSLDWADIAERELAAIADHRT
ncbi:MAG: glycosyltransferase family 4 protein [Chloroflexi bacterium]|nr:glycosyltransferase family 4 protein [Chloroflexota bacterium]